MYRENRAGGSGKRETDGRQLQTYFTENNIQKGSGRIYERVLGNGYVTKLDWTLEKDNGILPNMLLIVTG